MSSFTSFLGAGDPGPGQNFLGSQGMSGSQNQAQLEAQLLPLEQTYGQTQNAAALPGFDSLTNAFNQQAGANLNDTGVLGPQGSFGQQQQAANLMYQQALGNGPSIAAAQMNQGLAQAQNNAAGMLAGTGNQLGGGGLRDALQANAQMAQQAAGQGAVARAQEQLGAMGQYGQMTNALSATQQQQEALQQRQQMQQLAALQGALQTAGTQQAGNLQAAGINTQNAQTQSDLLNKYVNSQTGGFKNTTENVGNIAAGGGKAIGGILSAIL